MRLFETARQTPLFLVFFLTGTALGALYDLLGIFRKNKTSLIVSDVFFSITFTVVTGAVSYFFNSGEFHLYFYFGEALGILTEHKTLGYFIKISMDFFQKILYNLYMQARKRNL